MNMVGVIALIGGILLTALSIVGLYCCIRVGAQSDIDRNNQDNKE